MKATAELQQFCQNWLASWTGNQPEKLVEYYADEVTYIDPANPTSIKGRNNC